MTDNQYLSKTENSDFGYLRTQHFSRTLKAKAIVKDKRSKGDDHAAIHAANLALETLSKEFASWMQTEVARLESAYNAFITAPKEQRDISQLFRAAHDLRGQASVYGYPLIGDVAGCLSKLLDQVEQDQLPLTLIEYHIKAIKIMYMDGIKDYSDKTSVDVLNNLRLAIDNFVNNRNVKLSNSA